MKSYIKISSGIFISLFLFFSCGTNLLDNKIPTKESFEIGSNLNDSTISNVDFQKFWKKFRNFIVDSNQVMGSQIFQIPFIIKGYEDNDPQLKLNNLDSINRILTTFLYQKTLSYDSVTNHFQLIESIVNMENNREYVATENNMRIEYMVFNKTKSGWRLSKIYMDTKDFKRF